MCGRAKREREREEKGDRREDVREGQVAGASLEGGGGRYAYTACGPGCVEGEREQQHDHAARTPRGLGEPWGKRTRERERKGEKEREIERERERRDIQRPQGGAGVRGRIGPPWTVP